MAGVENTTAKVINAKQTNDFNLIHFRDNEERRFLPGTLRVKEAASQQLLHQRVVVLGTLAVG